MKLPVFVFSSLLLLYFLSACNRTDQQKILGTWQLESLVMKGKTLYDREDVERIISEKMKEFPAMKPEDSMYVVDHLRAGIGKLGDSQLEFKQNNVVRTTFVSEGKTIQRQGKFVLDDQKGLLTIKEDESTTYAYTLSGKQLILTRKKDGGKMLFQKVPE